MKWALTLMLGVAGTTWASDSTLRGRFYWGHEVESFQPCGSKKAYWVKGDKKVLQPLRDRTERLREQRGKPYQPIYVEAVGTIDTKSKREGFAEDYQGHFHLRKVARVSNVVPKVCSK
jgi:hypothetical protein